MRKKYSRKGDNGRVLAVVGSSLYVGAAYLCSMASLRVGSDLVTVAAPEKVAWTLNSMTPDIITRKIQGNILTSDCLKSLTELAQSSDVLLIGCGIGTARQTMELVRDLVKLKMPKVIDADAIKAVKLQDLENSIITPHLQEFEILLKNSGLTHDTFKKNLKDNVILLKGQKDKIMTSKSTIINKTGNPGMTVGGTGDVLAGFCAGLVSQGYDLPKAAICAAEMNGNIGDYLYKMQGYGFTASDFLKNVPKTVL